MSCFPHHCDKAPARNDQREEGFLWTYSSIGFHLLSLALLAWGQWHASNQRARSSSPAEKQQRDRMVQVSRFNLLRPIPVLSSSQAPALRSFQNLQKQHCQLGIKHLTESLCGASPVQAMARPAESHGKFFPSNYNRYRVCTCRKFIRDSCPKGLGEKQIILSSFLLVCFGSFVLFLPA